MPAQGKISSTEKLLQVIRKGDSALQGTEACKREEAGKKTFWGGGRKKHLGVYLSDNAIYWVCLQRHMRGRSRVEKVASTPVSFADVGEAVDALRRGAEENGFLGGKNEIWGILDSSQAVVHNLVLPKMAEKEIPNAVYWSLKKNQAISEETVLDFEIQGERVVKGIPKLSVLALTCPRSEVTRWRDAFERAGLQLTGLTVLPLSIQNVVSGQLDEKKQGHSSCAFLHIELTRTHIAIFHECSLALSREIRTGVDSMVEALQSFQGVEVDMQAGENEGDGQENTVNLDSSSPASDSIPESLREKILKSMNAAGEAANSEKDSSGVLEAVDPALQRLAQQVERSFSYFTQHQGFPAVEKVCLSGHMAGSVYVQSYLRDQLGVEVQACNPGVGYSSAVAKSDYHSIPALGAALSVPGRTLNLIFTYAQRKASLKEARMHKIILVATAVLAVLLFGYGKWEGDRLQAQKKELAGLEERLAGFSPRVDESMLVRKTASLKARHEVLEEYAARFSDMAAFREAADLTPEKVLLSDLNLRKSSGKKGQEKGSLIVEGYVTGPESDWETHLISYLVRLGDSPLLGEPVVYKRASADCSGKGRCLNFAVRVPLSG
jgi:type IV pilus assembly protein PilM